MNIWVFRFLACPADKTFPLNLTVNKLTEKTEQNFYQALNAWSSRNLNGLIGIIKPTKSIKGLIFNYNKPSSYHDGATQRGTTADKAPEDTTPPIVNGILQLREDSGPITDYFSRIPTERERYFNLLNRRMPEMNYIQVGQNIKDSPLNFLLKTTDDLYRNIKNLKGSDLTLALALFNYVCYWIEIEDGLLFCSQCRRWYPILHGIPRMLLDNIRQEKIDRYYLYKYAEYLPSIMLNNTVNPDILKFKNHNLTSLPDPDMFND